MLTPGAVLQGRYRIIRQIGGGGQALVYLAEDTNLGSLRAVKELTTDPHASPQERQAAYNQFQREARVLAKLNHPNLARVWDHFRVGDNAYLIMDYVDGQTLQEIVDQTSGFLPEAAVQRWAGQLCDVLDYLHRQHPPIIFRDLKPSNVMLDRSDTVKLIDFGIVRHFKAGQTADTVSMGTPGYAPLEQHGRGQTDARSDIYALGATLYHLVTRHEPEPAPARVLPGQPDPLQPARVHNPKTRPATEAALAKAMAVGPVQRFRSALEMKRALMGAVSAPTPTATVPPPAARRLVELRWPLLALVAVFIVVIWFMVGRGEPSPPPTPTVAPAVVLVTNTATPAPGLTASPTATPMPPTLTSEPLTPTKAPLTAVPESERVWEKDGSVMVHVPAGEFLMGSKEDDPDADDDEHPQHAVYVSEFWIDKTMVTHEQYGHCMAAGACQELSSGVRLAGAVRWYDAQSYCEWVGKRLPTEAEWERAARWMYSIASEDRWERVDWWEWCQDWYDEGYYANSPQRDPQGPSSGEYHVIRGGRSWGRVANRGKSAPDSRDHAIGFRCVSQPP